MTGRNVYPKLFYPGRGHIYEEVCKTCNKPRLVHVWDNAIARSKQMGVIKYKTLKACAARCAGGAGF